VRYFGGTLLGVPGLINAYKTVASLALQVIPVVQKQVEVNYKIQFDYTRINEVMMVLKQYSCSVLAQEMQLFCSITAGIPNNRKQEVLYKLKEIPGADIAKS
jgi:putative IMPACT (imprinted ancient) family translation regulator